MGTGIIQRDCVGSARSVLDALLAEADSARASDIHIEPTDGHIRIRMRLDGELVSYDSLPSSLHAELIARIKVLSGLRTDEHQRPQDGRFRHELLSGDAIDVRVATTPTYFGERAVLRLLHPLARALTLSALGLRREHQKLIIDALERPQGLIVASGPTGSGKTSTLYALLQLLTNTARSIITIEDPVEYAIPSITQIQTNERTGLTFETGLRSILRQDPDTIMVGEIRDTETARLAINAALTGHGVLSSIHTNDAPSTIPRLVDLSVEPYLLPSTIKLIIAQRLVRRTCTNCKREHEIDERARTLVRTWTQSEAVEAIRSEYRGTGCDACQHTGYRGRIGIFELLTVTDPLRELITRTPSIGRIRARAREYGMRSLMHDGLHKVQMGITTLEEIVRIAYA